ALLLKKLHGIGFELVITSTSSVRYESWSIRQMAVARRAIQLCRTAIRSAFHSAFSSANFLVISHSLVRYTSRFSTKLLLPKLTVRANFREKIRIEISSWNERTHHNHPRANRRYPSQHRLSTEDACGRIDRHPLPDQWQLDGLESGADVGCLVNLH